ncbi:hypothetical protein JRI60_10105 [Archangium violaceum]|uniref:hypothetical protein n=1 Tax=Archangium violaceum TaxID=83451 RepID=UPI00194E9B91|nr:hypothetical protein [Archangium violaceum]QRN99342.1 hypothetical protein JRI60_10105 [Archangium violaceum]
MESRTGVTAQESWWRRVAVAGAFGVPMLLLVEMVLRTGDASPGFVVPNVLYWVAPHGVVFLAHKFGPFVRGTFLTPALLAVSAVLVGFWCWTRWSVPPREAPIAWLLYPLVCVAVLFLVWMATLIHAHHRKLSS